MNGILNAMENKSDIDMRLNQGTWVTDRMSHLIHQRLE